jgi:lactoylglutathione lyase
MNAKFLHTNFNVFDLNKSIDFYHKALGLTEVKRKNASDSSFTIVFFGRRSKRLSA